MFKTSWPTLRALRIDTSLLYLDLIHQSINDAREPGQAMEQLTSLSLNVERAPNTSGQPYESWKQEEEQDKYTPVIKLLKLCLNVSKMSLEGIGTSMLIYYIGQEAPQKPMHVINQLQELTIKITKDSKRSFYWPSIPSPIQFQQLTTLKLIQDADINLETGFGEFLSNNFPKLETLQLTFMNIDQNRISSKLQLNGITPCLTIHQLQIYSNNSTPRSNLCGFQVLRTLVTAKSAFPNLTSITMDLNSITYLTTALDQFGRPDKDLRNLDIGLTTVLHFQIVIPSNTKQYLPRNLAYISNYKHARVSGILGSLFPAVSSLELVVNPLDWVYDHDEDEWVVDEDGAEQHKYSMLFCLDHFNTYNNKLMSLKIHNYYADWLGELLKDEPNVFPELKHLTLTRNGKNPIDPTISNDTFGDNPGLTSILNNHPGLETLEIDVKLFTLGCCCSTGDGGMEGIETQIENRKITNPNLRIIFVSV